jgi:hypothetical protein
VMVGAGDVMSVVSSAGQRKYVKDWVWAYTQTPDFTLAPCTASY